MATGACPNCNTQNEYTAASCTLCGAPLPWAPAKTKTAASAKPPGAQKAATSGSKPSSLSKEARVAGGCSLGCLGVLVLGFIGSILFPPPRDQALDAYDIAVPVIRDKMKNPDGATFPSYSFAKNHITCSADTCLVYAYVDDTNSFGATVRTHWAATVKGHDRTDMTVEDSDVGGPWVGN